MICHFCSQQRGLTVSVVDGCCPTCARVFPSLPSYLPSGMVIVARVNRAAESARLRGVKIARLTELAQINGPNSEWASLLADTLRS